MDIDPVVREPGCFGHDERNREEIPERQPVGSSKNLRRGSRIHRLHEAGDRHRRHDVPARETHLTGRCLGDHAGRDAVCVLDSGNSVVKVDLATLPFDEFVTPFPHHPGTMTGILEFLDEAGDLLLVPPWCQRVDDCPKQVEVLDPLGRPVGLDLIGGNAPHLLGVGLEEDAVEPPAKLRGDIPLEGCEVLRRPNPHPEIGKNAPDRLEHTEVAECIERPKRVVVEATAIEDPAHTRPQKEIFIGKDLVPQVSYRLDLGEEAVPTDIESPVADTRRARNAAHDSVGLEHDRFVVALAELVGRRETGRAGTDDHGVCSLVLLAHSTPFRRADSSRTLRLARTRVRRGSGCVVWHAPSMPNDAFACPRCGSQTHEKYYGPCTSCRAELRATMGGDAKDLTVEYEPKMNVTPNAVALKDD